MIKTVRFSLTNKLFMRILAKFWLIVKIQKVSYIDVYATMADIIGTKRKCNEAPDSRSLLKLIEGSSISQP